MKKKMAVGERIIRILKKMVMILLIVFGLIILYDIFCAVNIIIKAILILLALFIYGIVTG